jgi:hypothetical protein
MNTDEISPKAGSRLNRIRIVSRIARWVVIGFFLFAVCFSLAVFISSPSLFTFRSILIFINQIVLCVWYWNVAQLFREYEHGQIFAAETIRYIKRLGLICVAGAALKSTLHFLPKLPLPPPQNPLPPGVTITTSGIHSFQIGFFSFDFGTGVDFGLIFSGITIVIIAWIMDEGRKIQEEQELTV